MKILVVTSTFPRRAGDTDPTFVFELSRRLVDATTAVHVLAPAAPNTAREEHIDGLHVHRFRYFLARHEVLAYGTGMLDKLRANPLYYLLVPFFIAGMTLAIFRTVRREGIDVVHAHWLIPQGFAAALALWPMRRPPALVTTSHGGDLFGLRGRFARAIKRRVIAHSTALTVVSHYMREFLHEQLAVPCDPVVLPMGVDLQARFRPVDNSPRQRFEVIFVGRLVEKKGVACLLEAFATVAQKLPQAHLTVVGDGPLRKELASRADTLGIGAAVGFLGAVTQDRLPALYSSAALAIVPSIVSASGDQEGLGLVTVEALGCGCAVIASNLPAIQDVIAHGENGILVPPADPAALAAAIVALLEDDAALARYQRVARASVADRFDWAATAARYRDVLTTAAQRR